jgi:hypothetical protein
MTMTTTNKPVVIADLSYSNDEYLLWDSYTGGISSFTPLPDRENPLQSKYLIEFKKMLKTYYAKLYSVYYPGSKLTNYDPKMSLKNWGQVDENMLLIWVSFNINEAYNLYRVQNNNNGTDFVWASNPQIKTTIEWLEDYFALLFAVQNLQHTDTNGNILDMSKPENLRKDSFGSFKLDGGYDKKPSLAGHNWFAHSYLTVLTHYTHLFSTPFLISARKNVMASLTAQVTAMTNSNGWVVTLLNSQWSQNVAGLALHCSFLLQSEKILRLRGFWHVYDNITVSDRQNGMWSNADMLAVTNTSADLMNTWIRKYGLREFLGSYPGFALNMILKVLLHAPNWEIYYKFEEVWKQYWWDFSANFLIKSNCTSGPMARSYRPLSNVPEIFDHLYIEPFISPFLTAYQLQTIPINSQTEPNFMVFAYCMRVAGGACYNPCDRLQVLTLNQPLRVVEQRFNNIPGQERYNFISPNFSIGHAGEDNYLTGLNCPVAIRLAGKQTQTLPKSPSVSAVSYIRFMVENSDQPFSGWAVGNNNNLTGRLLISQYQNYMLTTALVAPSSNASDNAVSSFPYSLNTNLFLPLFVDGLYVNNRIKLPTIVGTLMALPPNPIFTIRHQGATVVCRLIASSNSPASNIAESSTIQNVLNYQLGHQPFSIMWQVDSDGFDGGCGRIVLHHKHPEDPSMAPYFVSWLIGAMDTPTDTDQDQFTNYIKGVPVTQTLTTNHDGVTVDRQSDWSVTAQIGTYKLNVTRQDIFKPNNGYPWPIKGYNIPPYQLMPTCSRTVNGIPMLKFVDGENPFKSTKVAKLYKPY